MASPVDALRAQIALIEKKLTEPETMGSQRAELREKLQKFKDRAERLEQRTRWRKTR